MAWRVHERSESGRTPFWTPRIRTGIRLDSTLSSVGCTEGGGSRRPFEASSPAHEAPRRQLPRNHLPKLRSCLSQRSRSTVAARALVRPFDRASHEAHSRRVDILRVAQRSSRPRDRLGRRLPTATPLRPTHDPRQRLYRRRLWSSWAVLLVPTWPYEAAAAVQETTA